MAPATYRLTEAGAYLDGLRDGVEVYDSAEGRLLRLVSVASRILVDAHGAYFVLAQAVPSDRDATELTEAEFAALPQVTARREE